MSEKPLRILHVMASPQLTGAAATAISLAWAQKHSGAEVLVVLSGGRSLEGRVRELGVPLSSDVVFQRSWLPHRFIPDVRALRRLLREWQPDVVHSHLTRDQSLALLAMRGHGAPKNRPPLVRSLHRPGKRNALRRYSFARTDAFLVPSEEERTRLLSEYEVPGDRVDLMRGFVDPEDFRPDPENRARMRKAWGIPDDAVVAGIVSRLRAARGIDWLMDAAERVLPNLPKARLVICGRGNYKRTLRERIDASPVRPQIHYAGYVSGEDLKGAYNAFDVGLLLKPGNDATCRAALEAMASGKAVVAGETGALRDYFGDGEAGWTVPLDDREALAEALRQAWTRPNALREKGEAARQRVLERHTPETAGAHSLEFYRKILPR